ncbi:hypothetical protein KCP74_13295 [Salmonella enterica subsp. enterica]|nr:hypothetical protein KCP74_13295 [Salmonella enterica subsp. enterica]
MASPVGAGAGEPHCWSGVRVPVSAGRSDLFEGFNRTMYNFNFTVLTRMLARPVAVARRLCSTACA